MKRTELLETAFSESVTVDRESGVIRNVKILGRESKNGRTYAVGAMEQARTLYADKEVNLDHPEKQNARQERKISEQIGVLKNTARRDDGVYGDLHYLKTHPMSEAVIERAERFPRSFGLSHNAVGQVKDNKDGAVVESVDEVFSVDLVSRPATVAGLFESHEPEKAMSKTVREILSEYKTVGDAAHLLSLLEQDDFAVMADAPVAVDDGASAAAMVEDSFVQMAIAVLKDTSLDKGQKVSKIRKILNMEETLMAPPAAGNSSDSEETAESDKALQAKVAKLERLNLVRDLCESHELPFAKLDAKQQKLLEAQADADAIKMIIESWAKPEAPEQPPPKPKPAIGSALKGSGLTESYEALRDREKKISKRRFANV